MKIKAILVDDELKSLEILENKLNRLFPEIEIIGATELPERAIVLIEELKPQLVFLDVAMPKMSGFDLLLEIDNPTFEIIFVTAFDQYAIDAIRHCAIGYLIKPIDNDDLVVAVRNALKNIADKTAPQRNHALVENNRKESGLNKMAIPTRTGFEFIEIQNIIRCEGVGGYTKLFFKNQKSLLSSYSIGYYSRVLEGSNFYFCHKSHLINLAYVKRYLNEGFVELAANHKVPVSKSRKNDFLNRLRL